MSRPESRTSRAGDLAEYSRAATEFGVQDLVKDTIRGLSEDGIELRAVNHILRESAISQAEEADERRWNSKSRSKLDGVPFGVKDLIDVAGAPTTLGTPGFCYRIATQDAGLIKRIRTAGAIPIAKLATTPLAGIGLPGGVPEGTTATKHPWDRDRWAGGSSGGSVAAVSAGLVPFAIGSETGGSLINPSGWCGVTGLRPTYGSVPTKGCNVLSPTLDKFGVIARTAVDCSVVFVIISGQEVDEPSVSTRSLTFGYLDDEEHDWAEHCRAALLQGRNELAESGGKMIPVELPASDSIIDAMTDIAGHEAANALKEQLLDPLFQFAEQRQRECLARMLVLPPKRISEAHETRVTTSSEWRKVFETVDVVVAASSAATAPRLGEDRPSESRSGQILRSANIAGLPGVNLPCGLAADGLPVGLHLIGPPGADRLLLTLADRYQRRTNHHQKRPQSIGD